MDKGKRKEVINIKKIWQKRRNNKKENEYNGTKAVQAKRNENFKAFSNIWLSDFVTVFPSYKEVLRNLICNPCLEYLS